MSHVGKERSRSLTAAAHRGWRISLLAAACYLAPAGLACDNGAICPSETVVLIASPRDGDSIVEDRSPEAGLQLDVTARSNLLAGDACELVVRDAEGALVETREATSDGWGDVRFEGVTVPTGDLSLSVRGVSAECGSGSDEIDVTVIGPTRCALSIREGTLDSAFYPQPVLNASRDSDETLPNFQAHVDLTTNPGFTVELFVTDVAEASAGTAEADAAGDASYALTLGQGQASLRATCQSPSGAVHAASDALVVFVDTLAPTCTLFPEEGTVITEDMDLDENKENGIQIQLRGNANPGNSADVQGAPASFRVGEVNILTPDLDSKGDTQVTATFDVASSATVPVQFAAEDRAGNRCSISRDYLYAE